MTRLWFYWLTQKYRPVRIKNIFRHERNKRVQRGEKTSKWWKTDQLNMVVLQMTYSKMQL